MPRRRGFRWWSAAWAVCQLVLPMLLSYADTRLESAGAGGPRTHVEASSRSTCQPVHSEQCAICQALSHLSAPLQQDQPPGVAGAATERAVPLAEKPGVYRVAGIAPARAPPTV